MPDQFVLKCTHDSGGLVICKDKSRLDKKAAKRKIEYYLRRKYYYVHREWPYKDVKPRIIAEKYMTNGSSEELSDYKFYCFDGAVEFVMINSDRNSINPQKRTTLTGILTGWILLGDTNTQKSDPKTERI
ncbi:hypothetical protein NHH09_03205 [Limosilactobacillus fermentum]|nr:hypothetical protein [Limosilactobacillus fermentum]